MPDSPAARPVTGVVAVVTAYEPDAGLLAVLDGVRDQVDRVVVVDDGSGPDADPVLAEAAARGALVLRQGVNTGIGAALNAGLRAAGDGDVLTLDQDSTVPPGYVAALLAARDRARRAGVRVAMVGPGQATGLRRAARSATPDAQVVEGREPIQSGLLVTADALAELGPFDASLFIDGVDTEYWLRARRAGFTAVVAPGVVLGHRLGRRHPVRVGGRTLLEVGHAAAFRYYYIARNRVVLVRRHGRDEPAWAVAAVARDLRHLAVTTVLVPGRRARWRETLAGLADARRGRTGRRPATR